MIYKEFIMEKAYEIMSGDDKYAEKVSRKKACPNVKLCNYYGMDMFFSTFTLLVVFFNKHQCFWNVKTYTYSMHCNNLDEKVNTSFRFPMLFGLNAGKEELYVFMFFHSHACSYF